MTKTGSGTQQALFADKTRNPMRNSTFIALPLPSMLLLRHLQGPLKHLGPKTRNNPLLFSLLIGQGLDKNTDWNILVVKYFAPVAVHPSSIHIFDFISQQVYIFRTFPALLC